MSTANTFTSMKANLKETYPKKERFKKLKTLIQPKGKATAEKEASENPEAFMKKMKNASIKKLKGVAL